MSLEVRSPLSASLHRTANHAGSRRGAVSGAFCARSRVFREGHPNASRRRIYLRRCVVSLPTFEPFPSIARLSRSFVVTEKIDGTNAQVFVGEDGTVLAGSRSRWLTTADDNFGFAAWVKAYEDDLRTGLGPGTHFGEWWGAGIQRGYGRKEKRFSLFNVARWGDEPARDLEKYPNPTRPACCHVVPYLGGGPVFDTAFVDAIMQNLRRTGSFAAPGFMNPEGIVVWHEAARVLFKKTLDGDAHKGAADRSTP